MYRSQWYTSSFVNKNLDLDFSKTKSKEQHQKLGKLFKKNRRNLLKRPIIEEDDYIWEECYQQMDEIMIKECQVSVGL